MFIAGQPATFCVRFYFTTDFYSIHVIAGLFVIFYLLPLFV